MMDYVLESLSLELEKIGDLMLCQKRFPRIHCRFPFKLVEERPEN